MKTVNQLILKSSSLSSAKKAITDFNKYATETSVMLSGFKKETVVKELMELIQNPDSFHPGVGAKFSGDAAIIAQYVLRYMPEVYVNTIIDLYNTGKANYNNGRNIIRLTPSQNIRRWAYNTDKNESSKATSQLFLYTLREHFNEIDYYRGAQNTIWACSFLHSIWGVSNLSVQLRIAEELVGFSCEKFGEQNSLLKSGKRSSVAMIQNLVSSSHLVIMLVNREQLIKTEIEKENSDINELPETDYITILKLISLDENLLWMQWWDSGCIHEQIVPVNELENILWGGFYIKPPAR